MKLGRSGADLIKSFEKLELTAYLCPAGKWTIGWGHTGPDVYEGLTITEGRAEALFQADAAVFGQGVESCLTVQPTQSQFDAMVALAFNIGMGWSGKKKRAGEKDGFRQSSVLRYHNAGNPAKAAESFMLWNKATGADGVKRELKGLTRRRAAEAAMYLTPTVQEEEVDPQRTRAADVEPTPVAKESGDTGNIGKIAAYGAATSAAATAAAQTVGQVESVWGGFQRIFGAIGPHVALGVLGLLAVLAVCATAYMIVRELKKPRG